MHGTKTRLQTFRAEAAVTQRALAAALGVTENTYRRWEYGATQPRGRNLVALARFFGVEPASLLEQQ